jgi:hypothetical protein
MAIRFRAATRTAPRAMPRRLRWSGDRPRDVPDIGADGGAAFAAYLSDFCQTFSISAFGDAPRALWYLVDAARPERLLAVQLAEFVGGRVHSAAFCLADAERGTGLGAAAQAALEPLIVRAASERWPDADSVEIYGETVVDWPRSLQRLREFYGRTDVDLRRLTYDRTESEEPGMYEVLLGALPFKLRRGWRVAETAETRRTPRVGTAVTLPADRAESETPGEAEFEFAPRATSAFRESEATRARRVAEGKARYARDTAAEREAALAALEGEERSPAWLARLFDDEVERGDAARRLLRQRDLAARALAAARDLAELRREIEQWRVLGDCESAAGDARSCALDALASAGWVSALLASGRWHAMNKAERAALRGETDRVARLLDAAADGTADATGDADDDALRDTLRAAWEGPVRESEPESIPD